MPTINLEDHFPSQEDLALVNSKTNYDTINTKSNWTFANSITLNGQININAGFAYGLDSGFDIFTGATNVLTPAAVINWQPSTTVTQLTPTSNTTINITTPASIYTGLFINFEVITSGATSFNVTFGTGFKAQGVLATGSVNGKTFMFNFLSDGSNWVETCRTTAM